MLVGFLLFVQSISFSNTASVPPTIAIVPPVTDQKDASWLGLSMADDLGTRLLRHSKFDPANTLRIYPLSIFEWRQTLSAAREAQVNAHVLLSALSGRRLAETLGADALFTAVYWLTPKSIKIIWRLVGRQTSRKHKLTVAIEDWPDGIENIVQNILKDLKLPYQDIPSHTLPAVSLVTMKNYGQALEILRHQSLDPRARVVLSEDMLARAYQFLVTATDQSPSFARAWIGRAIISAMRKQVRQAEDEFAKAMSHSLPYDPSLALGLYYLYYQQDKMTEAIEILKSSTETHKGFLLGLGYLGQAYMRANHPEKALVAFTTYQRRAPTNPWAIIRRSEGLARIGKHSLASKEIKELLTRFPDSLPVLEALAARQADAKRLSDSEATIKRALTHYPQNPRLLGRLAYVYIEMNQVSQAIDLAKTSIQYQPASRGEPFAGYAHMVLGHALALQGKTEAAFQAFRKAEALGVDAYDRLLVLRDKRLKTILNDFRCPLRTEGAPLP